MRLLSFSLITLIGFLPSSPALASKRSGIKQVIHNYFDGYQQAKVDLILEAFHPDVRLLSVENDKLEVTEMALWLEGLRERRVKGDIRPGTLKIKSIDVKEYAATAKIEMSFEKFNFTDYLSLLKLNGKWIIVGKIYHFELR